MNAQPTPAKKPVAAAKPAAPAKPLPPADQAVLKALRSMIAAFVLTGAVAAFLFSTQRSDILFKTDGIGQLKPLQSMNTPNLGSDAVINWAKLAVSEIFTYNFNNVTERMNGASRYFTTKGWDSFVSSAQEKNLIGIVRAQRQFVTTVPLTAVIAAEFEENGSYHWIVQMSTLTAVYTGVNTTSRGGLTLKIAQIPTKDSWAGYAFGITQITR